GRSRPQPPKTTILTTKPAAKTSATDARISARRRLALRCRSSMAIVAVPRAMRSADHARGAGVELGRRLEGVPGRRRRHLPLQTLGRFPGSLRRLLALAAHHRQHDEDEEVDLHQPEAEAAYRRDGVEVGELHRI